MAGRKHLFPVGDARATQTVISVAAAGDACPCLVQRLLLDRWQYLAFCVLKCFEGVRGPSRIRIAAGLVRRLRNLDWFDGLDPIRFAGPTAEIVLLATRAAKRPGRVACRVKARAAAARAAHDSRGKRGATHEGTRACPRVSSGPSGRQRVASGSRALTSTASARSSCRSKRGGAALRRLGASGAPLPSGGGR